MNCYKCDICDADCETRSGAFSHTLHTGVVIGKAACGFVVEVSLIEGSTQRVRDICGRCAAAALRRACVEVYPGDKWVGEPSTREPESGEIDRYFLQEDNRSLREEVDRLKRQVSEAREQKEEWRRLFSDYAINYFDFHHKIDQTAEAMQGGTPMYVALEKAGLEKLAELAKVESLEVMATHTERLGEDRRPGTPFTGKDQAAIYHAAMLEAQAETANLRAAYDLELKAMKDQASWNASVGSDNDRLMEAKLAKLVQERDFLEEENGFLRGEIEENKKLVAVNVPSPKVVNHYKNLASSNEALAASLRRECVRSEGLVEALNAKINEVEFLRGKLKNIGGAFLNMFGNFAHIESIASTVQSNFEDLTDDIREGYEEPDIPF